MYPHSFSQATMDGIKTPFPDTGAGKWPSLIILATACMLVLSLWFTATAALPGYMETHVIPAWHEALLSSSVQAGFVVGSLTSAVLGLPDRLDPRRFFAVAALTGAIANALFLAVDIASPAAILCRFVTGAIMAGVYPVAMKMTVSWADRDAGLLVGLLVSAFTLGTAAPYLFGFIGDLDPVFVLGTASVAATIGAVMVLVVRVGPHWRSTGKFQPRVALTAWRDPALRRANFGYFGHMWELYAFWAWIGLFMLESFEAAGAGRPAQLSTLTAFFAIAVGAIGAVIGGLAADRIGRTALTSLMLIGSGACCLLSPVLFGAAPWILVVLAIVWGITVVGDSAQFSTSVAELSPPGLQGTMLTLQTATGFALSILTVQLVPVLADWVGWQYALAPLVLGPVFGTIAMLRLRGMPDALKLAHGRR